MSAAVAGCSPLSTSKAEQPERIVVEWPVPSPATPSQSPTAPSRGPTASASPGTSTWLAAMTSRNCVAIGQLASDKTHAQYAQVYRGLAAACNGVLGAATSWGLAQSVAKSSPPPPTQSCQDLAAYRLLANLVEAHRLNPIRIEIIDPPAGTDLCTWVRRVTPTASPDPAGVR